jgi:hypothetical protein
MLLSAGFQNISLHINKIAIIIIEAGAESRRSTCCSSRKEHLKIEAGDGQGRVS